MRGYRVRRLETSQEEGRIVFGSKGSTIWVSRLIAGSQKGGHDQERIYTIVDHMITGGII